MNIQLYLRQQFNNRIRPFFIKDECECCGKTEDLELHHDDKHFSELLDETLELLGLECKDDTNDYSEKELESISLVMLGKQIKTKYLTVCTKCHDNIHSEVGINVNIYKKRKEEANKHKEKEKEIYAKNILLPYLESIINKKLKKDDLNVMKDIFIQGNIKSRSMGINSINKLLEQYNLPFILIYKRKSKQINNKIAKISHWEINAINKECQL